MKINKFKIFIIAIIFVAIVISIIVAMYNKKEYKIEEVNVGDYRYYILYKGEKMGVIDVSGNVIIDTKYEYIEIPNQSMPVFICYENSKGKAVGMQGEDLFTKYDDISSIEFQTIDSNVEYEKNVLRYKQNDKYGLIDLEGNQITKAIYDEIQGLQGKTGELSVRQSNKYGVINTKGAKIIDVQYDNIEGDGFYDENAKLKYERCGYIVRQKTEDGYKFGYIDSNGKMLLKTEYNQINRITENPKYQDIYLIARKDGQVGMIKNKEIIINFEFQNIEYDITTDLLIMEKGSKYGIYNIEGNQILKPEYDEILLKGVYIHTQKENEEKYYDITGREIKDTLYISMNPTENKNYYISIDENGLCGVVDKEHKVIIKNEYIYMEYLFDEYFIASKQDTGFGIINTKGDIVIDFKYDVLSRINKTNILQAEILQTNTLDIYSKSMEKKASFENVIVDIKESYIDIYSNGIVKYFNFDGEELSSNQVYTKNKLIAKTENYKWGFVDTKGNFIINNIYDEVTEFNIYGFAGVKKDNKWGVIDIAGNIVLEPTYELKEEYRKPDFIGKYYKIYNGYGQVCYTDEQ